MTRKQRWKVHKFHEQQGIKPIMKQTSTDARIVALEAKLGIASQPKEGDVKKKEGETSKEPKWGRSRGNPAVTCLALGAKHKGPSSLLGSSNGDIYTSCVDKDVERAIYASVQIVHLSAHRSIAVVKTKIELDSHANTCVVGDHCLIVNDHIRPVNVCG